MKQLSIIVPCHNAADFLVRCLDSILNQTINDLEIICVNDASPDHGITILRNYEARFPNKVTVIDLKENVRQGGARNVGMRFAKGKYIGFVDADDFIHQNMYEQLYTIAEEHDADVVVCKSINTYKLNTEYYSEKTPTPSGTVSGGEMNDVKRTELLTNNSVAVWGKIYKKDFIIQNNILFPEKLTMEDIFFTPLVNLYAKSIYYIDDYMYFRLLHQNSTVHNKNSSHIYDRLKIVPLLLEELKKRGFYKKYKDAIDYNCMRHYYSVSPVVFFNTMNTIELDRLYEMRSFIRKHIPNYNNNPYIHKIPAYNKVLMSLLDVDPEVAYEYLKSTLL